MNDNSIRPHRQHTLITESDDSVRRSLQELLESQGYTVEAVIDGVEALKRVHAAPPDLLITDAVTPGLDGFSLCHTLRADPRFERLPVLLVSASYRAPHCEQLARAAGVNAFLRKPAAIAEWLDAIRTALATPPPTAVPESEFISLHTEMVGAQLTQRGLEFKEKREEPSTRETHLRGIFDSINDFIFIAEPGSGRILDVNLPACEQLGYTREELLSMTVLALGPPEEAESSRRALRSVTEAGNIVYERHLCRRDGTCIPCEVSARRILLEGRDVIVGMVRDISERKDAEAWRDGQNKVLAQLVAGAPLRTVLETVVLTMETRVAGAIGSILLLDDGGKHLRFGAAPHLPEELNRSLDGMEIGPASGACGTAAHERELVIIEDFESDPRGMGYRELSRRYQLRACWSQPVLSATGEVLGTFAMYYREPRRPTVDEQRQIAEAGNLVAVAIETTRNRNALMESETRFRAIFEQAAVGMAQVAPDGHWMHVNQELCDMIGYTREELLQRTFQDITYPEDLDTDLEFVRQMLAGEIQTYNLEKRYIRKDGSLVWIDLTVALVRKPAGEPKYFISVVEDISARKQAETALNERDEILRLFVAHSPAAIGMFDNEMRYIAVSRRWLTDYGLGDRNIIGRGHYDIFPEIPQDWKDIHRRCLRGATERGEDDPFVRADGHIDWVKWEICPWRKADGGIGGIIIFSELVTERKLAEQKLRETTRQLETLSRRLLAAQEDERRNVARELHDEIGQLLTVVKLDLQTVLRQPGTAALAPTLKEGMDSIDRVIARVRDLSLNLRPSMLDDLGLVPALRWLVQRQARHLGPDVEVILDLPLTLPRLPSEIETACFRITQEALTNAVRHAHASRISVTLAENGRDLILTVCDNGTGFHVAAMRNNALVGGGFGLLGMQERVELNGGVFRITSKPEPGTTIEARFPYAKAWEETT